MTGSSRVVRIFALLALTSILAGCIPVSIDRTISFNADGSGNVSIDASMPDSMLVEGMMAEAVSTAPAWANARASGGHLTANFTFSDCRDLNTKLASVTLSSQKENVTFVSEETGELLKRRCVFRATIAPTRPAESMDAPISLNYRVNMPGKMMASNSFEPGVWRLTGRSRGSLEATSMAAFPLNATATVRLGLLKTTALLEVRANKRLFPEYGLAEPEWERFKQMLRRHFDFCTAGVASGRSDDEEGTEYDGLQFSGSFSDLQSAVAKAFDPSKIAIVPEAAIGQLGRASQGSTQEFVETVERLGNREHIPRPVITRKRSGVFTPRYAYVIKVPTTKGTSLEGLFDYCTLKIAVPGDVISANTEERVEGAPGTLVWELLLTNENTVEFSYRRTAWEIIVPLVLLLLAGAALLGATVRPRGTGSPAVSTPPPPPIQTAREVAAVGPVALAPASVTAQDARPAGAPAPPTADVEPAVSERLQPDRQVTSQFVAQGMARDEPVAARLLAKAAKAEGQRSLRSSRKALALYREFLDSFPNDPRAGQVEEKITRLWDLLSGWD